MSDSSSIHPVADACQRILRYGDLSRKLAGLPHLGAGEERWKPLRVEAPARNPELALVAESEALPRPADLRHASARALCLARFAHHELMAVELFAWAILRWPGLPAALLRDWLRILGDEQLHCRLYLDRLAAHDAALGDFPCSNYFWRHSAAIGTPAAFLAAMGLTLEQANLDFSVRFADAFRRAGDEESALVLQRVHRDEVGHVASAARWLRYLDPNAPDDIARYERAVPFPFSAARAKGRPFCVKARQSANLEASYIEHVRNARSSQERARNSR